MRRYTELYTVITHLAENLRVAKNDDTVLCTGESYIETPWVVEETDALVFVASHAAEDDVILLPPLKGVNASDLDLLVEILLEGTVELHKVDDV